MVVAGEHWITWPCPGAPNWLDLSVLSHQHRRAQLRPTGSCVLVAKGTHQSLWHHLQSPSENNLGVDIFHSQPIWADSVSLDNFQEHFRWKDSAKGVTLKRPRLQTMHCTIRHANSNITIHNCKEQKSEPLWQKERSMTHQVRENPPDFIQDHPVQRRPKKPSVSSADNLLEPMVFTKL